MRFVRSILLAGVACTALPAFAAVVAADAVAATADAAAVTTEAAANNMGDDMGGDIVVLGFGQSRQVQSVRACCLAVRQAALVPPWTETERLTTLRRSGTRAPCTRCSYSPK